MTDDVIRLREEIAEQIKCLEDMKKLAEIYGYDISRPATKRKKRQFSGYTSDTLQQSRHRMVQQCQ